MTKSARPVSALVASEKTMAVSSEVTLKKPEQIAFIDLAAQQARLAPALKAAIDAVLADGQYILGPQVGALEKELAAFCGAAHCVTCANGTDALTLVLMAEAVGPGDAVFVPSFTFVATAEAVAGQRATPIFVDIDDDTYTMDASSLERAIAAARAGRTCAARGDRRRFVRAAGGLRSDRPDRS